MPLTAAAVIGGVSAISKGITGISELSNANKLAANNKRPLYDIQKEYYDNVNSSEAMAEHGLTQKALQYNTEEAQRGLSSGEDTALQLGGGLNSIGALYNGYQRGVQNLAQIDAEKQNDNIRQLLDRRKDLAAQKTQQWVLNKYEPFKDTAKAAAQEKAAGLTNIQGALGDAAGVATGIATGGMNTGMLPQQQVAFIAGRPTSAQDSTVRSVQAPDITTAQYIQQGPQSAPAAMPLQLADNSYQNYSPAYPQLAQPTANDIYSLFYGQ